MLATKSSQSSPSWKIKLLDASSEADYQSLVETASCSPLSHTLTWRDILRDLGMGEPVYWLAYYADELIGALPAFVRRANGAAVLNSLPFVQSTGGIIASSDLDQEIRATLVSMLIRSVLDWSRDSNIAIVCVIGSAFFGQEDELHFPVSPDFSMKRPIQAIDLTQTSIFPKFIRRMVSKAQRFNPLLREASSLEEARIVYDLYAMNMRRIGVTPHDWILYQSIFMKARANGWTRFVWAEAENGPAAGLILMRRGRMVDYYALGSTELGRNAQMNTWLCAQQISLARAEGVKWWNWMASPSQQVHDFKQQWGGVEKAYSIWLWKLGDITALKRLPPAQLSFHFPGYFVLPYDWLTSPG